MDYHINNEQGDTIASFENESDRDYCLEIIQDVHSSWEEVAAVDGKAT